MTARELAKYFASRAYFMDPDQEVRFVLSSKDDPPFEEGTRIELAGSTVPERGEAVVAFRQAPARKYRFALRFEATPVIEARSLEEAERKARDMMRECTVYNHVIGRDSDEFDAQEPCLLEEAKE